MGSVVIGFAPYEITLYGVPCDGKIHNQVWDVVNMLFHPGGKFGLPTRCPHIHEYRRCFNRIV